MCVNSHQQILHQWFILMKSGTGPITSMLMVRSPRCGSCPFSTMGQATQGCNCPWIQWAIFISLLYPQFNNKTISWHLSLYICRHAWYKYRLCTFLNYLVWMWIAHFGLNHELSFCKTQSALIHRYTIVLTAFIIWSRVGSRAVIGAHCVLWIVTNTQLQIKLQSCWTILSYCR